MLRTACTYLGFITYICISYVTGSTEKGQFSPLAQKHKKVGAHFRSNHALMLLWICVISVGRMELGVYYLTYELPL